MSLEEVLVQFIPVLCMGLVLCFILKCNFGKKARRDKTKFRTESARIRSSWDDDDSITGFGIDSSGKSSYGVKIGGGFISQAGFVC